MAVPRFAPELLDAARAGQAEALGELLQSCRDYLLLIANQSLDPRLLAKGGASDLVQQTFLEAHQDFARFAGASDVELRAWLRQLLLNNLHNFARHYRDTAKRTVEREVPLEVVGAGNRALSGLQDEHPTPRSQAENNELREKLQQALARLAADYRLVIEMRYLEQFSFPQIAEKLGRSSNAVRKLWQRALACLQTEMEGLSETRPSA